MQRAPSQMCLVSCVGASQIHPTLRPRCLPQAGEGGQDPSMFIIHWRGGDGGQVPPSPGLQTGLGGGQA